MPSSGPGRQTTIRRRESPAGKKKGKKRLTASQTKAPATPAQTSLTPTSSRKMVPSTDDSVVPQTEQPRRFSVPPPDLELSGGCPTDDIPAMQQLGDQVDEYYFGVRIFPGQDPANVWIGWVTPQFHSYSRMFDVSSAVRKCRFTELDQHGYIAER